MVNTGEFTKRLHQVMEHYHLSAAAFADKIQVGRSSISHLLSGRNKPSLDFVLKVIQTFPEVELYWLLNGKGNFPAHSPSKKVEAPVKQQESMPEFPKTDLFSQEAESSPDSGSPTAPSRSNSTRKVKKVVLFYDDGTFEAFEN